MEGLKKLKVTRSAHRGQATKLWDRASQFMLTDPAEIQQSLDSVSSLLEAFSIKLDLLEKLDNQILELIDDERVLESDDYIIELRDKRYKSVNFVSTLTAPSPMAVETHHGSSNFYSNRLPKLSLPKFGGDFLSWQTFWDSFASAVHDNTSMSPVDKFNYLKCQLMGEALRTVEGLPLANNNYQCAIALLKERFGQPHKIINAHMQSLIDLPRPSNQLHSLQQFDDNFEKHIRGLEANGKSQDTYGDLLVPIIHAKLTEKLQMNLAREHGNSAWSLKEIRAAIQKEINILEAGESNLQTFDSKFSNGMPTATSFYAGAKPTFMPNHKFNPGAGGTNSVNKPKCAYCDNFHSANNCAVVKNHDDRVAIIRKKNLCFNCLNSHRVAHCNSKNRCRHCTRKHHSSICDNQAQKSIPTASSVESPQTTSIKSPNVHATLTPSFPTAHIHHSIQPLQKAPTTLLKTAVVMVESGNAMTEANIHFDEGAQRSFISIELAMKLGLKIERTEVIHLSTFGAKSAAVKHVDITTVYVIADSGKRVPINAIVIPTIAMPLQTCITSDICSLPHIRCLKLAHPVDGDDRFVISLLIGVDHYWDLIESEVIRGPGPTAVKSKIGYLLSGPIPHFSASVHQTQILHVMTQHKDNEIALDKFRTLESLGIQSEEDEQSHEDFFHDYQAKSTCFTEGQYSAKLPWKESHPPLPSNYAITRNRTRQMVRRLNNNPDLLNKYSNIIQDQLDRGFIERVIMKSTSQTDKEHYIPHHPVYKDSTTTPIRIVYDCSCRQSTNFPSLNDCLLSGPPIINDLTSGLIRFRMHQYGITTDIEKAFLHIALDEGDRDMTRFFWLSDINNAESYFDIYRFKAVLFGATCSPFTLSAALNKHLNQSTQPIASVLARYFYVDNVVSGAANHQDAVAYYREARSVMSTGNFNLRSWASNSSALRQLAEADNVLDHSDNIKVLGIKWQLSSDTLCCASREMSSNVVSLTKRLILRDILRVYDPLGFLSPVTVRAKILMQSLWRLGLDWDKPVPDNIAAEWSELAVDIEDAQFFTLPRCYFSNSCDRNDYFELHIFGDSSQKAYGTVAYITNSDRSALVMAKTRVAPLKQLTLPKLELMAAVISVRLAIHIHKSLSISRTIFWSDSQIVLSWLSANKQFKPFVSNRVKEINKLTSGLSSEWKYCPTTENPADLLTIGLTADGFRSLECWKSGPPWLTAWQTVNFTDNLSHSINVLAEAGREVNTPEHIQNITHVTDTNKTEHCIDIHRYSNLTRLLRVTAWTFRFINNARKSQPRITGSLYVCEIENAHNFLVKQCQQNSYSNELLNIKSESKSRLLLVRQLRLFVNQDGILRCGGGGENP